MVINNFLSSDIDNGGNLAVDAQLDIALVTNNSRADGNAENILSATVKSDTMVVGNVLIDFEITSGGAVFIDSNTSTTSARTNAANYLTVKFTDTTTGTGTIKASVHLNPHLTKEINYNFSKVEVIPNKLILTSNKENVIINKQKCIISADLTNSSGAPVNGASLYFTINNNAKYINNVQNYSGTTDNNGHLSVEIIDDTAETVTIRCQQSDDDKVKDTLYINFIDNPMTNYKLSYNIITNNSLANGIDKNTVVITLLDTDNKVVPGQLINFIITDNGSSRFSDSKSKQTSVSTNNSGSAQVDITSIDNDTGENLILKFSLASNNTITSSCQLTFRKSPPPQPIGRSTINIVAKQNHAVADGTDKIQIIATLHDPHLKPISNETINFSIDSKGSARFTDSKNKLTSGKTDSNGAVTAFITSVDKTTGEKLTVKCAREQDQTVTNQAMVDFVKQNNFSVTMQDLDSGHILSNGKDFHILQFKVKNNGQPYTGEILLVCESGSAWFSINGNNDIKNNRYRSKTDAKGIILTHMFNSSGIDDKTFINVQINDNILYRDYKQFFKK